MCVINFHKILELKNCNVNDPNKKMITTKENLSTLKKSEHSDFDPVWHKNGISLSTINIRGIEYLENYSIKPNSDVFPISSFSMVPVGTGIF